MGRGPTHKYEKFILFFGDFTMLKKIEAIIREDKVNDVKDALIEIGIVGLNIFEIRGHGRQGGIKLSGRAGTYMVDMLPKIQVNIILSEHNLEETIQAILKAAYTGEPGDGLIFVYPVEEVIRIRTGERGQDAVMYPGDIDEKKGRGKAMGV
jgi:nitrogen regulatory protein P-II 1